MAFGHCQWQEDLGAAQHALHSAKDKPHWEALAWGDDDHRRCWRSFKPHAKTTGSGSNDTCFLLYFTKLHGICIKFVWWVYLRLSGFMTLHIFHFLGRPWADALVVYVLCRGYAPSSF
jgi:hypothetical protein